MVVQTNKAGQTVTLSWDGAALPADRFFFTLVDLATGARIDMTKQNSYSYAATGADTSEARFRIQVIKLAAKSVV